MAAGAGISAGDRLEEKLTRVTLWLEKLYGCMPVPWYEVNERTVDILHEVMKCNEERDKDVMLLIEDMKDQTAKYEAEAEYWRDILEESLGLCEGCLPKEPSTSADITDLIESALELEVENTSLTSFYSAINNITLEVHEKKSRNNEMELKVKNLTRKLTSALTLEKQLKEDIKKLKESLEAQQVETEIQSNNLKFLENKSKDLKIRIMDAVEQLVARGLDQTLMHESLIKSSEELAALRKELEPLKKELASYRDLPLSVPLARVMVEEARKDLKALDEEFIREIEAVPFQLM